MASVRHVRKGVISLTSLQNCLQDSHVPHTSEGFNSPKPHGGRLDTCSHMSKTIVVIAIGQSVVEYVGTSSATLDLSLICKG